MKKTFIALAVLAALAFGAVPSQALIGTPDAVPGTNVLVPFFIVSKSGYGNEDALIAITEVGKATTNFTLKYVMYNRTSGKHKDFQTTMTPKDVFAVKASELIDYLTTSERTAYEYDLNGDGTNDSYIGYIEFYPYGSYQPIDTLHGYVLVYDLAAGKAGGYLGASREYAGTGYGTSSLQRSSMINTGSLSPMEAFSGNAYSAGKELLAGRTAVGASWFQLSPRYYVLNASAENYFFIWADRNLGTDGSVTLNYYDEAENPISTSIDLPYELNVLNVKKDLLPATNTTYPSAGWVDITMTASTARTITEWLGYNYMLAAGAASETWLAIFDIHRDAASQ